MDKEKKHREITDQFKELVQIFSKVPEKPSGPTIHLETTITSAAAWYEKLRNVIDFQDEHLLAKNAIARILRRHLLLGNPQSKVVAERLVYELIWAKYLENDKVEISKIDEIGILIDRYRDFLAKVSSKAFRRDQIFGFVLNLLACEIEEELFPHYREEALVKFTKKIFLKLIGSEEPAQAYFPKHTRLEIAIRRSLLKADDSQLTFRLFRAHTAQWGGTSGKFDAIIRDFDKVYQDIKFQLSGSRDQKLARYVKRHIPPFKILSDLLFENPKVFLLSPEEVWKIENAIIDMCKRNYRNLSARILRGTIRAILFVLFTKIILVFVLEVPFEMIMEGKVNSLAMMINTLLPPTIMLAAGFGIKVPGPTNTKKMTSQVSSIIFENQLSARPFELEPKQPKFFYIFDLIFTLISLAILGGVVWLLLRIHFNILSIALFFFFVSIISFLAFRIRSSVREVEVERTREGFILGFLQFLFLPFIQMGYWFSNKLSKYNVILFVFDFIIESPFKVLIGIAESWVAFVKEKKEEIE